MDNQEQLQGNQFIEPNPNPIQDGNPYFLGDHALIKFSNGEGNYGEDTYWLVDKENHTIRPFESDMALDAAFGEDLETALKISEGGGISTAGLCWLFGVSLPVIVYIWQKRHPDEEEKIN